MDFSISSICLLKKLDLSHVKVKNIQQPFRAPHLAITNSLFIATHTFRASKKGNPSDVINFTE